MDYPAMPMKEERKILFLAGQWKFSFKEYCQGYCLTTAEPSTQQNSYKLQEKVYNFIQLISSRQ